MFSRADAALYHKYFALQGKVEPVRAGLELTQRQLLTVVLVSSANNYAESLATWGFGSESAFLSAARTWLDAHGLTDTTLLDSTGMNPGNTSTASDLVELAKIALADPVVSSIVRMPSASRPYIGEFENTNELLASAVAGFREITLVEAGAVFYEYATPWEQSARAVAVEGASLLVWAGSPVTEHTTASDVRDGAKGQQVGSVTFTVADESVSVPLALDGELGDPGPWWRLTHPFG
jgi:D-alanyl-D-alanine carboxypeptidase (penicillin-binding protein 5/6)